MCLKCLLLQTQCVFLRYLLRKYHKNSIFIKDQKYALKFGTLLLISITSIFSEHFLASLFLFLYALAFKMQRLTHTASFCVEVIRK